MTPKRMKRDIFCLKNEFVTAFFCIFLLEFQTEMFSWSNFIHDGFRDDSIDTLFVKNALANSWVTSLKLGAMFTTCNYKRAKTPANENAGKKRERILSINQNANWDYRCHMWNILWFLFHLSTARKFLYILVLCSENE